MQPPLDPTHVIEVPVTTWHCEFCEPFGGEGAYTSMDWVRAEKLYGEGYGMCQSCYQIYRRTSGNPVSA